jgi:hypothetical protein
MIVHDSTHILFRFVCNSCEIELSTIFRLNPNYDEVTDESLQLRYATTREREKKKCVGVCVCEKETERERARLVTYTQ